MSEYVSDWVTWIWSTTCDHFLERNEKCRHRTNSATPIMTLNRIEWNVHTYYERKNSCNQTHFQSYITRIIAILLKDISVKLWLDKGMSFVGMLGSDHQRKIAACRVCVCRFAWFVFTRKREGENTYTIWKCLRIEHRNHFTSGYLVQCTWFCLPFPRLLRVFIEFHRLFRATIHFM